MTLPQPPRDPRVDWDLPPVGSLPTQEALSDVITRVVAPNPSPMTLDGTNTYVVAPPGAGTAVVVDPGPDSAEHLARVRAVLASRDAEVRAIVVTHRHVDHAAGAAAWSRALGGPVAAADPRVAGPGGRALHDGDVLHLGGLDVEVVATPGHTDDHVALRLGSGELLTGDHVLGRGTSVIARPDGDLLAYLASLRRVLGLGADALLPGHGPALTRDPEAVVRYYLDHRGFRREQVLALLALAGVDGASVDELVARVYADVEVVLWPAAAASTQALLEALLGEGRVRVDGLGRWTLVRAG